MTADTRKVRPAHLRRSWLFLGGTDADALAAAVSSSADVLIHEFEDFTPPDLRPEARRIGPGVLGAWKTAGAVAAVRVNPLAGDGLADLEAALAGAPDAVLLPKVSEPGHIVELDAEIARLERELGLPEGRTEIVPNVESARGLMQTYAICTASPRVSAALVASEDMAADLGAERTPGSEELAYVRARFHAECVAAGLPSIDCPYTWTDEAGLAAETRYARKLGYKAKSCVKESHASVINGLLTPAPAEVEKAERIVRAFEAAQAAGQGRAEVDGSLVEVPIYLNAKRLMARAEELAEF